MPAVSVPLLITYSPNPGVADDVSPPTYRPFPAFTVVFKIFTISLGAGWCVYRLKRLTGSRAAWLLYVPFLVPPGLYQSYNIHRMPSYAVLYLVLSCKLLCDRIEERGISRGVYALLCLALAVLTQWRSEGIYLLRCCSGSPTGRS